jgi:integrase
MSVRVRPYRRGGFEVDIRLRLPNGRRFRERLKAPVSSKTAAVRWGEARERELITNGKPASVAPEREVPTLSEFSTRFLDEHARAERQKPSGIAAKETVLRVHLVPALGDKKLNAITTEDVQALKNRLEQKASKTVNNVLTVLNMVLRKAVEWDLITRIPCTIRLLRVPKTQMQFFDFAEFERLVATAREMDPRAHLLVLLGGEAGLRCGEMMALEWGDIDLEKRQVCVQRSDWKGQLTLPKGGRLRYIPLTVRLAQALREHQHLRGQRVLVTDDGGPLTQKWVQYYVRRAERKAGLTKLGVHILRHTFCSHLAMRGAPARAIQELAGHENLMTTQRYMHLSPAALEGAIRLLDGGGFGPGRGDIVETVGDAIAM